MIYTYQCRSCGNLEDRRRSMEDFRQPVKCSKCGHVSKYKFVPSTSIHIPRGFSSIENQHPRLRRDHPAVKAAYDSAEFTPLSKDDMP